MKHKFIRASAVLLALVLLLGAMPHRAGHRERLV